MRKVIIGQREIIRKIELKVYEERRCGEQGKEWGKAVKGRSLRKGNGNEKEGRRERKEPRARDNRKVRTERRVECKEGLKN